MDHVSLHRLIQQKLDDGRLPQNSIPRVWGGPGNGEACDACEEPVPKDHLLMKGISGDGAGHGIQLHVKCFYFWDEMRKAPER
jgi:hypothetical protein